MRLRFYLLSTLIATAAWSCRSAPQNNSSVALDDGLTDSTQGAEDASTSELASTPVPGANGSTQPASASLDARAPEAAPSQDPSLSQDAERLRLIRERQQVLAAEYLRQGNAALERGDLDTALSQFSQALEVNPSSQEARDALHKVEALMGERFADASTFIQDAQEREMVRRAQARLSAEAASQAADDALRSGNFDLAIEKYREAQLILRYHPLIASGSLDEQIVTGKLNDAIALQADAKQASQRAEREAAEAAVAARSREEREYRENKLRTLYQQANEAFNNDNYSRAEALANQILLEDPNNEAAEQMRAISQMARHSKQDEQTQLDYREQWRRTFDELDTMDIPQIQPLVFDDLKRWNQVRERQALEFSRDPLAESDTKAVMDRLESTRFAVHFVGADGKGSPLAEVAAFLQNLTGVNFMISPKVKSDLDEEATTIKLELSERSVKKVLDIIAETHENLRWKIEDGVVKFVTKEELIGGQVLAMYEVRDIIHPVPNFAGREINVSPSTGLEQPEDNTEPREGLVVTSDKLEGLIRNNIAPASWNDDPKNSLRIADNGTMVVYQTPEVQENIKALLDDLREATGIMVDIQARFLTVEDNFLEDIGVDFRGLGQPGLGTNSFINDFGDASTQGDLGKEIGQGTDLGAFYDDGQDGDLKGRVENLYDIGLGDQNVLTGSGGLSFQWSYLNDMQLELVLRAVSKSERVELVTSPRVLVFNTARANIAVLNQVAYVKDFDVEIAQAASIADPIIDVVQDGVVLDVRPVVSADRRFILMELRPTVATLVRPIREQSTTLGSQNSVTIQLPEVDLQRVRTTVPMPDGGTVLLGGLKVSEKQDLRSGVPLVNKIPILRFLFERKGTYVTNRKLLILLKANIVIPAEHEPVASQMIGSSVSGF